MQRFGSAWLEVWERFGRGLGVQERFGSSVEVCERFRRSLGEWTIRQKAGKKKLKEEKKGSRSRQRLLAT